MVAVPAAMPVTLPVPDTVAIPGALVPQVPPPVASDKETDVPIQTLTAPDGLIATGDANTVTVAKLVQPLPNV